MDYTSTDNRALAEEMKYRIQPFLVSRQYYSKNLSNLISSDFLDLKVCYYILVDKGKRMLVSHGVLETYGLSADLVRSQALKNLKQSCCYGIRTMEEVLARMGIPGMLDSPGIQSPVSIYVLTNADGYLGAAGLFLDSLLADFAETINGSFFVIPSSIHEVLLIPESSETDIGYLDSIICEVNISQVTPEKVLSDHAYYYNKETRQLQTENYREEESDEGQKHD